ncbi:MAG: hypothetical protein EXR48_04450 [Dehalococcoidia bacterium]|nr:hypothetical protein [Dehalococcoidia bacterium]
MSSVGPPSILLASTNAAKCARLRELLEGLPCRAWTPEEVGVRLEAPETGSSHAEIALLKAVAGSRQVKGFALASDGGLLVPALGDRWNSLLTHRFAGADATDQDRAERLLRLVSHLKGDERRIAWVEAVALAQDGAALACWQAKGGTGVAAGSVDPALEPGFWVGGVWYFPALGKRYCDLTVEERATVGEPWSRLKRTVSGAMRTYLCGKEAGAWKGVTPGFTAPATKP